MPGRPKKLPKRPSNADDGTADVLADLLDTMRLGTLVYGRFELGAPWGIQFPEDGAAHLIVVGRGGARLEVDRARAPVALSSGDLALLPHGGAHTLRDAAGSPLRALGAPDCRRIHRNGAIALGGKGARTTLVIGAFRFRAAHRARALIELAMSRIAKVAWNRSFGDPGILQAYKDAEEAFTLTDRPLDKFTAAYTMAYSLAFTPNRNNRAMLERLTEARNWYLQLPGASRDSWRYLLANDILKGVIETDPVFRPLLAAS